RASRLSSAGPPEGPVMPSATTRVPRRSFLRGIGAASLLPLLDGLTPAAAAAFAAQAQAAPKPKPLKATLICGAPLYNHDFDFARQRLLAALYDAGGIQTNVARNYDDSDAIEGSDLLVSHTSQLPASPERCEAIRRY